MVCELSSDGWYKTDGINLSKAITFGVPQGRGKKDNRAPRNKSRRAGETITTILPPLSQHPQSTFSGLQHPQSLGIQHPQSTGIQQQQTSGLQQPQSPALQHASTSFQTPKSAVVRVRSLPDSAAVPSTALSHVVQSNTMSHRQQAQHNFS